MMKVQIPEESTTDAAASERLSRVQELHAPRRFDGEGFTSMWCRECRQNWPCPTAEAVQGKW